jgi:hypothetical protein
MDTHWTNIKQIDSYVGSQVDKKISEISSILGDLLDQIATSQEAYHYEFAFDSSQFANVTRGLLSNSSVPINQLNWKMKDKLATGETSLSKLVAQAEKSLAMLEKRLDSTTDLLSLSPVNREKFTETLTKGAQLVLSQGFQRVSYDSEKQVNDLFTTKGQGTIDTFSSQSSAAVDIGRKDWANNLKQFLFDNKVTLNDLIRKSDDVSRQIQTDFTTLNQDTMSSLDAMAASQFTALAAVKEPAIDAKTASLRLKAGTDYSYSSIKKLFQTLLTGTSEEIAEAQTSISQILNHASAGANDQLSALAQTSHGMSSTLASDVSELASRMSALIAKVRALVGDSTAKAGSQSGDTNQVIAQAGVAAETQVKQQSSLIEAKLSDTGSDLEKMAEETVDQMHTAAVDTSNDQSTVSRDTADALNASELETRVEAGQTENEATRASAAALRQSAAVGGSTNHLMESAGSDLAANADEVKTTSNSASVVEESLAQSSSQSEEQGVHLAQDLSRADTETASGFQGSMRNLDRSVGDNIDKALGNVGNEQGQVGTQLRSSVGSIEVEMNQRTDDMERGEKQAGKGNEVAENSLNEIDSRVQSVSKSSDQSQSISDGLTNDLSDSLGTSQTAASGVAAQIEEKSNDVSTKVSGDADVVVAISTRDLDAAKTKTDKIADDQRNAVVDNSKDLGNAILKESTARREAEKGVSDGRSVLGRLQTRVDNPVEIERLISKLKVMNSNVTDSLDQINTTYSQWRDSLPDKISAAVKELIYSLGPSEYSLVEAAIRMAQSGGLTPQNEEETLKVLANVGAISNDYAVSRQAEEDTRKAREDANNNEFKGITNKISDAKKFLDKNKNQAATYSDYMDSVMSRSKSAMASLTGGMADSVNAVKTSLSTGSASSASENQFNVNIASTQSQSLLTQSQQATGTVSKISNEAQSAIDSTISESISYLKATEESLNAYGQDLDAKIKLAESDVLSGGKNWVGLVGDDQNQVRLQLMMAKRAVRNLLSSWSTYVDTETQKFKKMNQSETEYMELISHRIDASNTSSGDSLRASLSGLDSLNGDVLDAASSYFDFKNGISSGLSTYRDAVDVLNKTSGAGISQLKEMAFNMNANDEFIDRRERDEIASAVKNFEAEIDSRTNQAVSGMVVFSK